MKVIFLQDVPGVAKKHDIKDINDGYAMNFLLPRKMVKVATKGAQAELEIHKREIVIERKVQENLLLKNLEEIKEKTITIEAKADEKGHLFSGIHKKEIVAQMKREHHADIGEDFIVLEKPIKKVGEFGIELEVHTKDGKIQKSSFKLVVKGI